MTIKEDKRQVRKFIHALPCAKAQTRQLTLFNPIVLVPTKNRNKNPAVLPFAMGVLFASSNHKSSKLIIDNTAVYL
jgi:hypothetical protein